MSWYDIPDVIQTQIISMGKDICRQELISHQENMRMSLYYIKYKDTEGHIMTNTEKFNSSICNLYQTFVTFVLYTRILYLYLRG